VLGTRRWMSAAAAGDPARCAPSNTLRVSDERPLAHSRGRMSQVTQYYLPASLCGESSPAPVSPVFAGASQPAAAPPDRLGNLRGHVARLRVYRLGYQEEQADNQRVCATISRRSTLHWEHTAACHATIATCSAALRTQVRQRRMKLPIASWTDPAGQHAR
jgi:hypothetical protein